MPPIDSSRRRRIVLAFKLVAAHKRFELHAETDPAAAKRDLTEVIAVGKELADNILEQVPRRPREAFEAAVDAVIRSPNVDEPEPA